MTRQAADSVTPTAIPDFVDIVMGYINGNYPSYDEIVKLHPDKIHVPISVDPFEPAKMLDIEKGDATPEQAPDWAILCRKFGIIPTCYMSRSNWQPTKNAFTVRGIVEPNWFVADPDSGGIIPPGAIGVQYKFDVPPNYDLSNVADFWPGVDGNNPIFRRDYDGMRFYRKVSSGLIVWSEGGHVVGLTPAEWSTYVNLGYKQTDLQDGPFAATIYVESVADRLDANFTADFAEIEKQWLATFVTPDPAPVTNS